MKDRSVADMRELYQELAAEPAPYIKRILRVYKKRGFSDHIEIVDDPNQQPSMRKYNGATRIEIIKTLQETIGGSLYSPVIRGRLRYELEDFLIFKCDCDNALRRQGTMEPAFLAHARNIYPSMSSNKIEWMRSKIQELSEIQAIDGLERKSRGRAKKVNSDDLMERYGHIAEAAEWIDANAERLDAGSFDHDDYRDPCLSNTVHLNDLIDAANGARKAA